MKTESLARFAYVGSRTSRERSARGEGLSVFKVEQGTGAITRLQLLADLINPSYLVLNSRQDRLYCVHGDGSEVSSFVINESDGELKYLNRVSTEGKNPVHLCFAPDETALIVSNHRTGSLAVLELGLQGELGALQQLVQLTGEPGPHRQEQPFAKPHFNAWTRTGHLLVPDKGLDRVFQWHWSNKSAGRQCAWGLVAASPPFIPTRECSGPRHFAEHPQASWVYVLNELDNTVCFYECSAEHGLHPRQILSSLSDRFVGNSRAAAIQVHPNGRWLYASNRGEDSIAVFAIGKQGFLRLEKTVCSGGRTPRFITLSPHARHLYALNEDSDSIVMFDVPPEGGLLDHQRSEWFCASPVCMVFKN
jgi:6-phosphogluconolactonase